MKKNKGITLIALIITIVIMIILVTVSISILINSGIIGKAKDAKDKTAEAYEDEKRVGDNLNIDGVSYNNVDEYMASLNKPNVKKIEVDSYGYALMLMTNGDLYAINFSGNEGEYVNYTNANKTLIANNVQEFNKYGLYLTTDNDFFCYNGGTSTKIASDVREFYQNYNYITTTNDLYAQDGTKLASNVMKYYQTTRGDMFYFITTSNDLCKIIGETSFNIANNVKEYNSDTNCILTTTNDLYSLDPQTKIASNVKEYYNATNFILTTTNELYHLYPQTKIASNVKEYNDKWSYLTETNDLYYYNGNDSTKLASNVAKIFDNGFLTQSNELCSNSFGTVTTIATNVAKVELMDWYQLNSGEIYIMYKAGK